MSRAEAIRSVGFLRPPPGLLPLARILGAAEWAFGQVFGLNPTAAPRFSLFRAISSRVGRFTPHIWWFLVQSPPISCGFALLARSRPVAFWLE